MTTPLVLPEPLGGGPLAAAALAGGAPAGWFLARPHTVAGWREHLDSVRAGHATRNWAEALAPALAPGGAAAARLVRVAEGRGVVVTTGQQPGLFGGPLYTWFKALSALALADAIEEVTGVPAAPIFWAATDDADFAEGAATWVAGRGGGAWVSLPVPDGDPRPLADVPLGDVSEQLDALTRGTGAAAAPEVLELVRRCYAADATVGGAYLALLRALLEPLGIAVLDAAHPSVGATAASLLRKALRDAPRVDARLIERERDILRAGFTPQVPAVPGLSLVFQRAADGTKARVPIAEAGAVAATEPSILGPNVL
ncbi:MAG TPA: bacillithiol biosynthesis BshC, partial [Gemmatimonadaceae bacterium]|nr:bacillithiol biosynthesis BshC [Gemmatimonadaceae bacterium]